MSRYFYGVCFGGNFELMIIVFTKLASQLTAEKLTDLAIIPIIFIVMTCVSYLCSSLVSRLFRFKKRQANFVTAMGVRMASS
jgi:predicted permease